MKIVTAICELFLIAMFLHYAWHFDNTHANLDFQMLVLILLMLIWGKD